MALTTSRRARRLHKSRTRAPELSLVSLMDIFTILVFFLLVNAGEVEVLPSPRGLVLPESTAEQRTKASPVIMVTNTEIQLQGKKVADRSAVEASPEENIPLLQAALANLPRLPDTPESRAITIMGDKTIPYRLLRKVMLSCSQAEYDEIALAVIRRER
jgi:biopolymer transport protein TolR